MNRSKYREFSTGWFGVPGRESKCKVHIVLDGKVCACGARVHPKAEYMRCAQGVYHSYLECERCKAIASLPLRYWAVYGSSNRKVEDGPFEEISDALRACRQAARTWATYAAINKEHDRVINEGRHFLHQIVKGYVES